MKIRKFSLSILLIASLLCYLIMPTLVLPTKAFAKEQYYCADGYNGEGASVNADETIICDYSTVIEDVKHLSAPSYGNTDSSRTNTCAPVTGSNVCGFYDRWYTNLIPNYQTGIERGTSYAYFSLIGTAIQTCIGELYSLMGTNVGGDGTSQSGFESGLSQYVNNKGYSITYQAFKTSSTSVNLETLKQAINSNKVAVMGFTNYNIITAIGDNGTSVDLYKTNYNVGHMMMVYGYKTVAYYKDGANFRTDTYLYISSGFDSCLQGYSLLGSNMNIVDADVITIS